MTIPDTSLFEQDVPLRPTVETVRYAEKVNDTKAGPLPTDGPSAEEWNQMAVLIAAYGSMIPCARFTVKGGASPYIDSFMCVRADMSSDDFTVTHVSTGVVKIEWPEGTFPAGGCEPKVGMNSTTSGFVYAWKITNGVRIESLNVSASAADRDFTVEVYGQ